MPDPARMLLALTLGFSTAAACAPRAPGVPPPAAPRRAAPTAPATVIGEIGGAPYRIDVPAGWNGGLVMFCHGYRGGPVRFDAGARDDLAQAFGAIGVAVAQSGY